MRKSNLWDYLWVTAGSLITALGLVLFLVPNQIAAGGVSGLATVIYYVFHWPVGMTMLLINIPLFLLGLKELGMRFGLKTLYGTIMLSVFTDLIDPLLGVPSNDPLLSSIYGGAAAGLGLGIVFRAGGTTGGTDLAAQLFRKWFKISSGQGLLIIDALVIITAAIVFSVELALYALVGLFLTSRVIDLVQEGAGYTKAALIISDRNEIIADAILQRLDRGATYLCGRGAYTGQEKDILMCVVSRTEISKLKALVTEVDVKAFVIVTDAHEVLGEGFKEIND